MQGPDMDMDLLDYLEHCQESRPLRRPDGDSPIEEEGVDESPHDGDQAETLPMEHQ
jgi:hypothetical protein